MVGQTQQKFPSATRGNLLIEKVWKVVILMKSITFIPFTSKHWEMENVQGASSVTQWFVGLIMLHLQKSSEWFLVFVIHDNYLLQWFYINIWYIIHFKFNILVVFSIRAVSKCQCLCICTILSCFNTMGIPLTALLRTCYERLSFLPF